MLRVAICGVSSAGRGPLALRDGGLPWVTQWGCGDSRTETQCFWLLPALPSCLLINTENAQRTATNPDAFMEEILGGYGDHLYRFSPDSGNAGSGPAMVARLALRTHPWSEGALVLGTGAAWLSAPSCLLAEHICLTSASTRCGCLCERQRQGWA